MNKTYIPLNDYKNIGGPTTFIKNLAKYFDQNSVEYTTDDHNSAQSILFPISYNSRILKEYKRNNKPIIQRLDGLVGFPWQTFRGIKNFIRKNSYEYSWVGPKRQVKFMLDMIQINNIYRNYTDLVIFQSEYCKNLCFDMLTELPADKYDIIYNGVHTDIFYPSNDLDISSRPTFIMTGRYRREDMILPVLDALDILIQKYDFKLKIIGPIEKDNLLHAVNKRTYIDYIGAQNSNEIANHLRASDIYIFSSLNAPCPNALLEAVASGLPVVSYDYGSIPELLSFNKDLIAPTKPSPNPLLKSGQHLDAEALADRLENALNSFTKHKQIALNNCKKYEFSNCGNSYLNSINKMIEK